MGGPAPCYFWDMTKPELARRLAEAGDTTPGAAADRLDEIVFGILKKLREGKTAALPGLARIQPAGGEKTRGAARKRKAQ